MTKKEIIDLLSGNGRTDEDLFAAARVKREDHFGRSVVLRGVIEMTNKCRVNCDFCPMRRDNAENISLFQLGEDDLVAQSRAIRAENINVIFVQGGEIPQSGAILERAIPRIVQDSDSPAEILLNIGNKTREEYRRLKESGATSFILKHETSNPNLYKKFKHQDLETRLRCLSDLLELGFRVGTGTIVGLPGQTLEDIADDILLAQRYGVHMASASPFLPAPGTPLENEKPGSVDITLRAIAITRILMPQALIPSVSALEAIDGGGQGKGLMAGANVLTINFTPQERVDQYLIYGKQRYIVKLNYVRNLLHENGLQPGRSIWA